MDLSVIELQIYSIDRKTSKCYYLSFEYLEVHTKLIWRLSSGPSPGLRSSANMALRNPISHICKHALSRSSSRAGPVSHFVCPHNSMPQRRAMATVVPPVTQDATSSKGPTAMVFMNMGGPSTTDEVGDFLSRLFVSRKLLQTRPIRSSPVGDTLS